VGPYLVARGVGKSTLMGPLEGPIGGLNRDPKGVHWGSSYPGHIVACQKAPSAPNRGPLGSLMGPLGGPDETSRGISNRAPREPQEGRQNRMCGPTGVWEEALPEPKGNLVGPPYRIRKDQNLVCYAHISAQG
jgi:hypothetical protein